MKLDDFITESLLDIKNGIREANVRAKGENPKPDAPNYFLLRPGSKQEIGAGIEFALRLLAVPSSVRSSAAARRERSASH